MTPRRRNTIVAGFGRKGSGKSQTLHDLFTSHAPRVISLDSTGETMERNPNAIEAVGFAQLRDVLKHAANYGRWHIAAALEPDDVRALFALLTPKWGAGESLSLALGGLAIECGEIDQIAPNSGTPPEILSAFRRGRHYALDLYTATQRPASVAVDVRSMADIVFSFALGTERDIRAVEGEMSAPVAHLLPALPRYHCLWHERDSGRLVELDAGRNVVRDLNPHAAPCAVET